MKIVIRKQGEVVAEAGLADGQTLAVGRQPDVNDLVITDIQASRKHGRIVRQGAAVTFEDLGSGNGTVIGNGKIEANKPVLLELDAPVTIGEHTLTVCEGEVAPAARPQRGPSEVQPGMTGMLECGEKRYGLGESCIFLGRMPACHIQIADALASRRNSEIRLEGGHYIVKDLDSGNGTFLNGQKITEEVLCDGDTIKIGDQALVFRLESALNAPPVPVPQTVDAPADGPEPRGVLVPADESGSGRMIFGGVLLVLIAGLAVFLLSGGNDEEESVSALANQGAATVPERRFPVMVGAPASLDMPVTLEKTADICPAKESMVLLPLGVKVEAVHVEDQQRVREGQKLVTIEMTESLRSLLTQAKASVQVATDEVAKAEAEVRKAQSAVQSATENLKIAQEAYDRNRPLYDGGNLLQGEWDKIQKKRIDARAAVEMRKEEQRQAQRSVAQAKEKVTQAQADLREAQGQVKDLTFIAKNSGIVTQFALKPGYTTTTENQALAIIEFENEVKAVVAVPEEDIARVRVGMAAQVWLSKAPEAVFDGTVSLIPATAEQRSYDVEVTVRNQDWHFRPGAQAMVRFILEVRENAAAVPAAALNVGERGTYSIYVLDPKVETVRKVAVRRGVEMIHEGRAWVEILDDPRAAIHLQPTSWIVIDGHKSLEDGARVTVTNAVEVGLKAQPVPTESTPDEP